MARLFAILALVAGCGSKTSAPVVVAPPARTPVVTVAGKLTLDIEPTDAEVEVDGSPRGKASELAALDLAPGLHQIVITKPGFEIWRGEVALEKQIETIQVRLIPATK